MKYYVVRKSILFFEIKRNVQEKKAFIFFFEVKRTLVTKKWHIICKLIFIFSHKNVIKYLSVKLLFFTLLKNSNKVNYIKKYSYLLLGLIINLNKN